MNNMAFQMSSTLLRSLWRNSTNSVRQVYLKPKRVEQIPKFHNTFERIRSRLTANEDHNLRHAMKRFDQVLTYNVITGKLNRGLTVVNAYQDLVSRSDLNEQNIETSRVVGWCVELLHSYFIIIDDLMDNSITRRGQQCWHLNPNVGLGAINDAVMLRSALFQMLKETCGTHDCYLKLLELFLSYCYLTEIGQSTDCLMAPDGGKIDFSMLNTSHYMSIINHKLSATFYLPLRAAMYLASIEDETVHAETQKVLTCISHLYQVQNDFLDLYGDPKVTGKIGTDIETGRCTWFAIEAFNRMTEEQCNLFIENYGVNEKQSVDVIKQIYDEINLKDAFFEFRNFEYESIKNQIENSPKTTVNANILMNVLAHTYDMKT